ncbi:hypothetical protein J4221_03090 [Candidatus Pacearchaeota archaeon]|nr:hypothetical protein [Candidatus Pacearchaeota archaeon]
MVLIILILTVVIIISGIFIFTYQRELLQPKQQNYELQQEEALDIQEFSKKMTFIVNVPKNTFEEDIVYFETFRPEGLKSFKMEKISDYKHKITFDIDFLEQGVYVDDNGERIIRYAYNRNNFGFITTEYLGETTQTDYWDKLTRKISHPKQGYVQEDLVERWKWFPQGEIDFKTQITPPEKFMERINGKEFHSGHVLNDLYVSGFDDFFNSTSKHMREQEYTWAIISPPWQWVADSPPKVANSIELGIDENPNYPSDEKLIEHIKSLKKEGIKVFLSPQICCTVIDTQNRNDEWWNAYFSEVERFLVHHAKIAEVSGADALRVDTFDADNREVKNFDEKMEQMIKNIRKEFGGEIGSGTSIYLSEDKEPRGIIPPVEYFTFGDKLDFFVISIDARLSRKDNPSNKELAEEAGNLIDRALPLHEKYNKPIIVIISYASIEKSWKGSAFYDFVEIMNAPWIGEREWKKGKYEFSGEDQARTINAYFEAIEKRPWITGLYNFGYWMWEMPLAPDMSIRGKPAEDLWKKWNEVIYEDD